LTKALQICQRCAYRLYEIDAELVLVKLYLAQNNPEQAKTLAQSAYEKAERMGYHLAKVEATQNFYKRCNHNQYKFILSQKKMLDKINLL